MYRLGIIFAAGLILIGMTGCIGTDTRITLTENGSGTMELSYRVSKLIAHLGKLEETDTSVPLPVGRDDFDRTVQRVPGISLQGCREREDEEDIYIDAELTFDDVAALNDFLKGSGEDVLRLVQSGSETTLVFDIYTPQGEDLSSGTADVLATMFQGYTLDFTLELPEPVQSLTGGTQSSDGRTVSLELSVSRLLLDNEPVSWNIVW